MKERGRGRGGLERVAAKKGNKKDVEGEMQKKNFKKSGSMNEKKKTTATKTTTTTTTRNRDVANAAVI